MPKPNALDDRCWPYPGAEDAAAYELLNRSVDIAYARFAYFFGAEECLPDVREVRQILRPGEHLFVIEANAGR